MAAPGVQEKLKWVCFFQFFYPVLKSLVSLAVPIVIANLLQAACQLVDAFWVGTRLIVDL
jgi:Na+-driven multidrug efflux pump